MTTLLEAVILGVVQGVTEWLPISSSGHLVMIQELWSIQVPLFFDVALHTGTVIAAMVYFRKEILRILQAVGRMQFNTDDGRMGLFILIGTIPTAIIGLVFHDILAHLFTSIITVGGALIITGTLLYATRPKRNPGDLNLQNSILIGTIQGVAIIPGISRSGATIATGILRGIDRVKASTYSFLLSIPAILGATALEARNISISSFQADATLVGVTASAIVGYIFIGATMKLVAKQKLHSFAYYCWIVGAAVILLSVLR